MMNGIDDINIRFTFKKDYIYDNLVPSYNSLIFKGLKVITDFIPEYPSKWNKSYDIYNTDDYGFDESDYNASEDAFYSGEYLPEDW